jgi:hypothetical protein
MYGDDNGHVGAVNNCLRNLFQEYMVIYVPNITTAQPSFALEA